MPLNFPSSPSVNDTYTFNNKTWIWDGTKWETYNFNLDVSDNVSTVSFSSTPTFDLSLGSTQKITLTGNVTSSTISNGSTGKHITFVIIQDSIGGRTFVWPTNVYGGMTVDSIADSISIQKLITYDGTNYYAETYGVTI
jgi:hypothetical protein